MDQSGISLPPIELFNRYGGTELKLRALNLIVVSVFLTVFSITCARANVRIRAAYSGPANLFSLMDNVSGWQEGLTDPAYREYWTKRFGWSQEDQNWAKKYREYRRRTYLDNLDSKRPSEISNGMFMRASSETTDPLAAHFFRSASVSKAIASFTDIPSRTDRAMLSGFYRHFAPKWRVLLAESGPLSKSASRLKEQVSSPQVGSFVARVSRFYRVDVSGTFHAFFVWYPPNHGSNAEVVAGRYFLIHLSPDKAMAADDWDTTAIHELVHFISAQQPPVQKRALTMQFLALCPKANQLHSLPFLEEPLAVAWASGAYNKYAAGRQVRWSQTWYGNPVINVLGHLIWPIIDDDYNSGRTIDSGFIKLAGEQCASLFAASRMLRN